MPRLRLAIGLACVATAACGGGGGGGGGPSQGEQAPPFTGEFHAVSLKAQATPTATSFWGPAASDGATSSLDWSTNVDGTLGGSVLESFGLSVAADGAFTLRSGADVVFDGAAGIDRNVLLAANVRPGDAPRILTLVRRMPTSVAADVAGSYRYVFFGFTTGARSVSGTATFDGAGAGTLPAGAVVNSDGFVSPSGISSPVTYGMDLDGSMDFTLSFASVFRGGLDVSRELAVLGGSTASGAGPGLLVFVRYAAATGPDVLSGTYAMVGLAYAFTTPAVRTPAAMRSFTGELVADGFGVATVAGTTNVEGVVAPMPSTSYTYTVSGNGALNVVTPEGTLVGGVCQSGDFAVLGGPNLPGSDPTLYLLVRR